MMGHQSMRHQSMKKVAWRYCGALLSYKTEEDGCTQFFKTVSVVYFVKFNIAVIGPAR